MRARIGRWLAAGAGLGLLVGAGAAFAHAGRPGNANAAGMAGQLPLSRVSPPPAAPPASRPVTAVAPAGSATYLSNFWGADISWPQCADSPPAGLPLGFVVVGLNDGRPFTTNPCLGTQLAFARGRTGVAIYENIDAPRYGDPTAYGEQVGLDAANRLRAIGLKVPVLWLDVELINHWSTPAVNVAVLRGAVAELAARGIQAGIYSSPQMWQQLTGSARVGVPVWTATSVLDYRQVQYWCNVGLGGHPATMAQYVAAYQGHLIDIDVLCRSALPRAVTMFAEGTAPAGTN